MARQVAAEAGIGAGQPKPTPDHLPIALHAIAKWGGILTFCLLLLSIGTDTGAGDINYSGFLSSSLLFYTLL